MGSTPAGLSWDVRPACEADIPCLAGMLAGQTPWLELRYSVSRCHSLVAPHLAEIRVVVRRDSVLPNHTRDRNILLHHSKDLRVAEFVASDLRLR